MTHEELHLELWLCCQLSTTQWVNRSEYLHKTNYEDNQPRPPTQFDVIFVHNWINTHWLSLLLIERLGTICVLNSYRSRFFFLRFLHLESWLWKDNRARKMSKFSDLANSVIQNLNMFLTAAGDPARDGWHCGVPPAGVPAEDCGWRVVTTLTTNHSRDPTF